ncbi:MAG: SHD1 domain-containing protein [Patescibacteria group bacterium]|nr:SHD1 domain-containing protein [Patescibacteria group bacterium]
MKRLVYVLASVMVMVMACGGAAESLARTWTSADGQHTFEAELVAVKLGWARLRSADGREVSVPLARLSEADRTFIAEHSAQPPAQPPQAEAPQAESPQMKPPAMKPSGTTPSEAVTGAVKLEAEVAWDSTMRTDADGKALPPPLIVSILARGEAAAQAVAFGFVAASQAEDDAGGALSASEDGFGMDDPSTEFVLVDRRDEFFAKHPAQGVRIPLSFAPPGQPIKRIALLQGTFKLRTGGTQQTVIVKGPFPKGGKALAEPALTAAQLVIRARSDDPSGVVLEIEGDREVITRLELTDAAGKELQEGYSTSESGGPLVYTLFASEKLPADVQVRIHLVADAKVIDVPFKFENLAVPSPPKRGNDASGAAGIGF